MIDPTTLSIDTALECCSQYKPDEECGICLEALVTKPAQSEDTAVVQTKMCGDKHRFHRACIMAWFRSATPNLNICPLDRTVLFGCSRVPQMPLNLPRFTEFPGHAVEEHEEFFANQREAAALELEILAERIHDAPQARENDYIPGQERMYLDDDLVAFFNEDETVNVDDTVD
jgi:hypothetical protein